MSNQMDELMQPLGYIATMARNDLECSIYGDVCVYGEDLEETIAIYTADQMRHAAKRAVEPLLQAAIQTLEENGHLADGDNCTLLVLRNAISKYVTLDCSPNSTKGNL